MVFAMGAIKEDVVHRALGMYVHGSRDGVAGTEEDSTSCLSTADLHLGHDAHVVETIRPCREFYTQRFC